LHITARSLPISRGFLRDFQYSCRYRPPDFGQMLRFFSAWRSGCFPAEGQLKNCAGRRMPARGGATEIVAFRPSKARPAFPATSYLLDRSGRVGRFHAMHHLSHARPGRSRAPRASLRLSAAAASSRPRRSRCTSEIPPRSTARRIPASAPARNLPGNRGRRGSHPAV
jgi:hypothetical protein